MSLQPETGHRRQWSGPLVALVVENAASLGQSAGMQLRKCVGAILSGTMLFLVGCEKQGAPAPAPAPAPTNPASFFNPTNAQPRLTTIKLWLGAQELTAELALTLPQVMTGMMFRKQMAENEGMLFVFARPHRASFFMRNTVLPLSCAYIDREGVILEIHDMKPLDESPIEAASENIQYVLEVKQGWFQRNNVATGAVMRTESGSLPDTFFRRRDNGQ